MKNLGTISISLSPNVEKDDMRLVFNLFKKPLSWKNGDTAENLKNTLA